MANIVLVLSVEDFLTLFEGKALLAQILANTEKIMTTGTDLTNAVSGVAAGVTAAITLIQNLRANPNTVSDADVESAVATLQQSVSDLAAAVAPPAPPAGP